MITDTEDNIGIIFQLEGNDIKVTLRSSTRSAIIKDTRAAR
jgi:hypothetical protein